MVWRCLASHVQATRLGERHHRYGIAAWRCARRGSARRSFRASRMSRATITSSEAAGIPRSPSRPMQAFVHVAARAQIQVFAVIDDRQTERLAQSPWRGASRAHSSPAGHRRKWRPRPPPSWPDGGQFFACAALGDRADREHVHHGVAARPLHDVAGDSRAVVHRLCIRHAADGREPARRRSPRAAFDGFGVLKAGLPQVHVHIDKARARRSARWHRRLRPPATRVLAHAGNSAVHEKHVGDAIGIRCRVHHPAVLD